MPNVKNSWYSGGVGEMLQRFTANGSFIPQDAAGNDMCILFMKYGRCRFKAKCKKSHWVPPPPGTYFRSINSDQFTTHPFYHSLLQPRASLTKKMTMIFLTRWPISSWNKTTIARWCIGRHKSYLNKQQHRFIIQYSKRSFGKHLVISSSNKTCKQLYVAKKV